MNIIKIGYFADGPWAHEAFKQLVNDKSIKISFICVRFDHKDPKLLEMGSNYGIDVIWSENINSKNFIDKVKTYNVDLFVSMSFNQIFRDEIINLPPLKTINCHAGKLPFYRGRNILNWALINDEKEFGITVHYVDNGIDTGDIILQKCYEITDSDDYSTLLERAYIACAEVLYGAIKLIQSGNVNRINQNSIDPIGLYCGMRTVGDELLDWRQSSREIFNFVRAICKPGPQALTYLDNKPVYINRVRLVEGAHCYKGTVGQIIGKTDKGWYVKTLDTMIEVTEFTTESRFRVGKRFKNE